MDNPRNKLNRNMAVAVTVAAVIIVAGIAFLYFPATAQRTPVVPEPLTLGLYPSDASALMYIADDRGYFSENRLAVTIRDYDPPSIGIKAAADGELDIAAATEYPVVINALNGGKFSIIARYDELNTIYLIGRRDRGIRNFSDLRGKTIGVTRGTIAEFNLGRVLTLNGIGRAEVTIENVQPSQFAGAIESGRIDALICWQPPVSEITGLMGDRVIALPAQSGQPVFGVLVARNELIAQNPSLIARFLTSLDSAAEYAISHPAESRAIVQRRTNLSDEYMAVMWPANRYSLTLDQSLVLAMEDEARWMIANNVTNATRVPDFGNYIYTKGLDEVKPGSVNIIRAGGRS